LLETDLISKILKNPRDNEAVENLLGHIQESSNIAPLNELIKSKDNDVVDVGTWIASELGIVAAPLIGELIRLFTLNNRSISFNVLDCIVSCSQSIDLEYILAGLEQLDSPDSSVVWKAQMLLISLDLNTLGALEKLPVVQKFRSISAKGLNLVLRSTSQLPITEVIEAIGNSNEIFRRYGVVAAVKLSDRDSSPLHSALTSDDLFVREFANSSLRLGLTKQTFH
jgi:hypothetical protein